MSWNDDNNYLVKLVSIFYFAVFPKFQTIQAKPMLINETNNLILPCNATGFPKPQINWQKINGSLPEGRSIYDSQVLNISYVQYGDRGKYKCTARNSVGMISTQVSIDVQSNYDMMSLSSKGLHNIYREGFFQILQNGRIK